MTATISKLLQTGNILTDMYLFREYESVQEFQIGQLHSLLKRNGKGIEITEKIQRDLDNYSMYLRERKSIWTSKRSIPSKKRETSMLDYKFAVYTIE